MKKAVPIFQNFLRSSARPQVYGMIHVGALPGAPLASNSVAKIFANVRKETEIYMKCGVDGIILENMHDIPYKTNVGPGVVAYMTRACLEVLETISSDRAKFKCGVQILAAANLEALSVAHAAEMDFIRVEGFVYSHVADEGIIQSCAGDLLRYRKNIGAENIAILADIKKKHCSHSITSDVSIVETAKAAEFFLADGVILTGVATGLAASENELKEVRAKSSIPVIIGSGITLKNAEKYSSADAFIVGSYFKKNGLWQNELDSFRISEFMRHVKNPHFSNNFIVKKN